LKEPITAPFLGMPPTGNKIKDQGVDIFVFQGDKIAEIWVNENDLGLMETIRSVRLVPVSPACLRFVGQGTGSE